MDQAGLVATALVGLWIAYLVPQRLRYRQQLLDSRTDDRFSEHLRVLRVAAPRSVSAPPGQVHGPQAGRVLLHPGRAERNGRMHRPHATGDRVSADAARLTAAEYAARAAALSRRSAGARRRATLTALLLVSSVAGWVGVALGAAVAVGVAPLVLLAAVLVLGRRAVLAGRRADAAWAAGAAARAARPLPGRRSTTVGRAVHPSEAVTEIMAKVPMAPARRSAQAVLSGEVPVVGRSGLGSAGGAGRPGSDVLTEPVPVVTAAALRAAEKAKAEADDVEVGAGWVPVPVPPPAYSLKPEARRPEPRPLTGPQQAAQAAARAASQAAAEGAAPGPDAGRTTAGPAERPTTGGLELDAILARRRAAGE